MAILWSGMKGLPPADYFVAITPPVPFASPPVPGAPPREQPQFDEFPERYRTPIGSGFEVTVKEEDNFFVFNMVRQSETEEPADFPVDEDAGDGAGDGAGDSETEVEVDLPSEPVEIVPADESRVGATADSSDSE